MKSLKEIVAQVKKESGGLLEAFHAIQEQELSLSSQAIQVVSEAFYMPPAQVYETASFYSYLNLEPVGKNVIRICRSAPCHTEGAGDVVDALEKLLGIKIGGTTPDGRFTLQYTECVGQCCSSPVITINREVHAGLTPDSLPDILAAYN